MANITETPPDQMPNVAAVQTQILIELKIMNMLLLEIAKEYGVSDNLVDMRRDITILND